MKITAPSADHEALGGVSAAQHHTKYTDANAVAAVTVDTAHIENDAVTGAKLNPSLVLGDLIYADGTDTIARLAKGGATEVLTMGGSNAPTWVAAAAAPVFGRVVRTAGNLTTTSTTLEDVTGATITFTTGAFPAHYTATLATSQSNAGNGIRFSPAVDGAQQLGTYGLNTAYPVADKLYATSFSAQTAALSAASHVIKLQWFVDAGTGTIAADSYDAFMWSAFEIR